MKHDCINPGDCLERHKADRSLWCGVCRRYVATLTPDAPKFKPGDEVIVVWPESSHYGNRFWLHERIASVSSGRPMWRASSSKDGDPVFLFGESRLGLAPGDPAIIDDPTSPNHGDRVWLFERYPGGQNGGSSPCWKAGPYKGGPWHWAIAEDSLRPVPIREPVIRPLPTFEERRAAMLARSAGLAKQPSPFARRYDPRDAAPVAMGASLDHDGQAVTPSLKPAEADDILREAFGPRPSTLSVVEGVERWRLIDPAHRRAYTQATGHVVMVWVTVIPALITGQATFCSPYTVEEVIARLDHSVSLWAKVPDAEVTMARNPAFEFAEDKEHLRS